MQKGGGSMKPSGATVSGVSRLSIERVADEVRVHPREVPSIQAKISTLLFARAREVLRAAEGVCVPCWWAFRPALTRGSQRTYGG